jgi:hypothetical protein
LAAFIVAPVVLLVLGVFLSGCVTPAVAELDFEQHGFDFKQYEIVTGPAERQTVLTGFLGGGAIADLAVVDIDENEGRRLRIYTFDGGTWEPKLDTTLHPEVLFVDVANIGGRDRMITYKPGELNRFDPASSTERALVAVTSDYKPPRRSAVAHVDITRDVNHDGRDDLLVPNFDGFLVFIQLSDGAFADPVKIGPSFEMGRIYEADGYRYDPWGSGRVHEMDYDRDGRSDLVFWNEDHFEFHVQDEHGLFAPVARSFTTDVAFDSDDIASLAAPQGVRRRRMDHQPAGTMTGRVLHALTDLNGDGVADLGVFSLKGGSLWKMHSTYEVHLGTPTPGGGTAIHSDGILSGMAQHDFDHDGQVDMTFTTIDPGVFKVVGMLIDSLLTDSVSVDLELYRMEGGIYPGKPNATRKIRTISFGKAGEKATLWPSVLIGDVNGDRRSDLLVQKGRKALRVYLGVPRPDLFARRPQTMGVAMPNEEYTWLVGLNEDGKQDVLMHHPSIAEPNRVTILVAR